LYPKRSRAIYIKTCQALQQNDLIITVSKRLLEEAKKMIPDIEGKTIYNGFNPNQFAPMDQKVAREQLGLSINGKQLLFVGNLLPVKGVNYLLDAFAQVAAHVPEVYLHLVGDGPLRSTLEQQVEKLKLKERVSFKGRRPYEEIPMWVNSADAVVLSSLSEGLPSILLETMGCGKPMIATDVGGIAEILQHGKTGFLVPSKQVKELSESMLTILQEEGLGIQMGTNALEASKELTWQQNAVNILQIYKDVSNRKSL
jgi:glycosyltransferase involved in cell wall biosynthesis